MGIVADRLSVIKPSATVALNSKAMEMKAAGEDVIGLAAGEPDFPTPDSAVQAGVNAIMTRRYKIHSTRWTTRAETGGRAKIQTRERTGLRAQSGHHRQWR